MAISRQLDGRLLADAFSRAFNWNIDAEEMRHWLRDISHNGPFRLILAIDDADAKSMGAELDGIASSAFRDRLQVVLSCDTGTAQKFTGSAGGRRSSPIGRKALEMELGLLDGDEFGVACNKLDSARIAFMRGAYHSQEYRNPWIMRAIAAEIARIPVTLMRRLLQPFPACRG
jgi:hypothetical protein